MRLWPLAPHPQPMLQNPLAFSPHLSGLVERAFSRAAATYDAHSDVQAEAASGLLARLSGRDFSRVLEVGCGTGLYTLMLAGALPSARIEAVDISPAMLSVAREKIGPSPRIRLTRADGEALPSFLKGGYDLVTSSGAFQWFSDMEAAFRSYRALMAPGALLAFAAFGPKTLGELNEALNEVLGREVALSARAFRDRGEIEAILGRTFGRCEVAEKVVRKGYPDLVSLLLRLKRTGANLRGPGARLGLTRGRIAEIEAAYRRRFGAVEATYQVFFGEGLRS